MIGFTIAVVIVAALAIAASFAVIWLGVAIYLSYIYLIEIYRGRK